MRRSVRRSISIGVAGLVLLVPMLSAPQASGAGSERAGIVVQYGDKVRKDCVSFDGTITGFQLVKRSKFEFMAAKFEGLGHSICWLDGKGCRTSKPKRCTDCRPRDGEFDGKFWGYYVEDPGDPAPVFATTGPDERIVDDGSIDYWVWGDGSRTPVDLSLDEICKF